MPFSVSYNISGRAVCLGAGSPSNMFKMNNPYSLHKPCANHLPYANIRQNSVKKALCGDDTFRTAIKHCFRFVYLGKEEMSKLLEIFGKAITVDSADLIWHWLNTICHPDDTVTDVKQSDFNEIVCLLGERNLDLAEEKLDFYLFENPGCPKGEMAAVAICLRKNNMEKAMEHLEQVYRHHPNNTMALYTLGYCYERLAHEEQALEFYQDCLKFKSHLQLPRQRMAAIYLKNGRIDKTIEHYRLLVTEHPEDISSMVVLGYLLVADKQYERAIDTFNMAIVAHPDNFHDDANSGMPEMETEEHYEVAIDQVQSLMEKVGEQPDLHVKMADIYSKAGRTADAIVHYEIAICAQPNYLEATIKLGTHYLRAQNASLAAGQFNRAIEINDDIVDAYVGLSVAQNFSGAKRDALKTLSLASAIQQNSSLLFSETAILNLQAALNAEHADLPAECVPPVDMKEVIAAHRRQLENLPRSADAHYKFGILMMGAGNLKGAVDSFQIAIEINPTHCRARSKLAICLHEANNSEAAIDILAAQDTLDHDTVALHYQIAMLYADRPKFAAAIQELENTMKNNLTDSDATENIQVVLENIGLVDRATATWDRLTETTRSAIGARYE